MTDSAQQVPHVVGVFDRAADIYESMGVDFFTVFGRWLVEDAALQQGENVLDVGCGRGAATIPAAEAVGATGHVTACDLAPRMLELLAQDVEKRGLRNVELRLDNAQQPGGEEAPFDCILAGLVVFMLPDPPAALRAYHDMLRPGGRFAMSSFGPDDERWSWLRGLGERFVPQERRPPRELIDSRWKDPAFLRSMVEGAGFSDVTIRDREHQVRFRDPQHWIDWSHSQGQRVLWEMVPPERHDELNRYATEQMEPLRDPADGTLPMRSILRVTTARRAS